MAEENGQAGAEIEITDEMIDAGRAAVDYWVSSGSDEGAWAASPSDASISSLLSEIFRSMCSVS